jgi:hypothetical protein
MRESTKKEEDWDPVSETSMVSGEERSQVETVVRALVWGGWRAQASRRYLQEDTRVQNALSS